jgi:hypothetical protein
MTIVYIEDYQFVAFEIIKNNVQLHKNTGKNYKIIMVQ